MLFFSDQGTVRIRSGLYRARQGLDLGCDGAKKNSRAQKYPTEIRLGGAPEQGPFASACTKPNESPGSTIPVDFQAMTNFISNATNMRN